MASRFEAPMPTQTLEQPNPVSGAMERIGGFVGNALDSARDRLSNLTHNKYVRAGLAAGAIAVGSSEVAQAKSFEPIESKERNLYTKATLEDSALTASAQDQEGLNAHGRSQVNSIHGFSVNFRQTVSSVEHTGTSIKTNYVCPPVGKRTLTPAIATTETRAGNRADVTFCPSEDLIDVSKPNERDKSFGGAFAKFLADPIRTREWGGDQHTRSMFALCPEMPDDGDPEERFKFDKKRERVNVAFDSGANTQYCDQVGQFTETVSAQVKKPRSKWKSVGRTTIRISGLRESLVHGGYGLSERQVRDRVRIEDTGRLCRGRGSKRLKMRIKLIERFRPNSNQTFAHSASGSSSGMRSGSDKHYSKAVKVCR